MTPKEALDILHKGIAPNPTANNECIELCKKALEKQIPKKPIYKTEELFQLCPNCDFPLPLHFKFCNHCGQALVWENEE